MVHDRDDRTLAVEGECRGTADPPDQSFGAPLRHALRRHPSLFGLPALLIVSLAITVLIRPKYSDFDLQSLAMGALPLAFTAAGIMAVRSSAR
jgi:hypothetical protein